MTEIDNIKFQDEHVKESCITCADYHGRRALWIDLGAKCYSEEVIKIVGKPLDASILPRHTIITGCRFWRKIHTTPTLAKCVIEQLSHAGVP